MDEMDGFDDFESDMSSSEEVATHNQPQKKSLKTGQSKIFSSCVIHFVLT